MIKKVIKFTVACDRCKKEMKSNKPCPDGWAYAQANGSKVGIGTLPLDELMFCPDCWVALLVWIGYVEESK